jgi:Protein of unknown function (DUF2752)
VNSTREIFEPTRPPVLPMSRTVIIVMIGLGVAMAAALAVLFLFNPTNHAFYPVCMFHQITGLNCPGCGSTRALHELLHGHVLAALHSNALLMLTLPFVIWLTARFLIRRRRGQTTADIVIRPSWLWIFLVATVIFTVLRNLPQFAWLSP